MTEVQHISPKGEVSIISAETADQIIRSAFMRSGNVSVTNDNGVWEIKDATGITTLSLVEEDK